MNLPKTSIIILNYNGFDFTQKCLNSILEIDYPNFEIILFDNGSRDSSQRRLRELKNPSPRLVRLGRKKSKIKNKLRVILNKTNIGFAAGNNQAAKQAKGKYLLFLNNDTEVEKDFLKKLINFAEKEPFFGAASPLHLSLINKKIIDAAFGLLDHLGWSKKQGFKEINQGQYQEIRETFYAQGSAFLIKKDIFEKIGGFDQDFFIYYEEVDLSWRLHLFGYKVFFVPESIIYHFGGGVEKRQKNALIFYRLRKNQIMMLLKNYGVFNLLLYLPVSLFLIILSGIVLGFLGQFSRSLAYFKALGYNLLNLNKTLKKRKFIQTKIRKIPDSEIDYLFAKKPFFFEQLLGK